VHLRQIALHAEDLNRAAQFYEAFTGTPPRALFDPPGLLFFDLDGTRLLLDRGAPSSLLYLDVDDIEAAVDRVRALGAPIESAPHVIFEHFDEKLGPAGAAEWQAFFRDSEGNLVGLVELRPA
jgi:methylmalonyl-CoA/ethylmalonyl-CoA epimerase